ncbi:CDP-diacylglycerol--glycerol-3-phosphate 3-phosphatidyltransferase [Aquifex sp.]
MVNYLTWFRVFVAFPVVFFILEGEFAVALALYLFGALTDWLDGNLARKNNEVNNFGKLLDPYADKVFVLLPLIALIEVGKVKAVWVILLTFRELSISFLRSLAVEKGFYMEASSLGKVKTFLEFLAISLILAGFKLGEVLLGISVVFAYISGFDYLNKYLNYAKRS